MAFYLTSDIKISGIKLKPNKVVWNSSVDNFVDTCTISLPRRPYLNNLYKEDVNIIREDQNEKKKRKSLLNIGDKVVVLLGYNGTNLKRFEGFIRRVNTGVPMEVECEGYCSQLYDIIFSKTYNTVLVKELLTDLIKGTDIKLSKEIPEIPLRNVRFKNASGVQVLQWLKKECNLSVYFNFDELYVGTMYGKIQDRVKAKIGWNIISDNDFKERKVDQNVKIVIQEKNDKGEVKRTKSDQRKYSSEKLVKVKSNIPSNFLKEIANRLQTKENYKGFEGNILMFLEPYVNKGMVMELHGGMFPEKSGDYFVQAVNGEFGENGGRQNVTLGYLMSK